MSNPFYFLDDVKKPKMNKPRTRSFNKFITGITHCPYCGNGLLKTPEDKLCIGCEMTGAEIRKELEDCNKCDEQEQEGRAKKC